MEGRVVNITRPYNNFARENGADTIMFGIDTGSDTDIIWLEHTDINNKRVVYYLEKVDDVTYIKGPLDNFTKLATAGYIKIYAISPIGMCNIKMIAQLKHDSFEHLYDRAVKRYGIDTSMQPDQLLALTLTYLRK